MHIYTPSHHFPSNFFFLLFYHNHRDDHRFDNLSHPLMLSNKQFSNEIKGEKEKLFMNYV